MAKRVQEQDFKDAFRYLDVNGTGSINVGDLNQAMIALGQNPTEAELREMVDKVDEDGNVRKSFRLAAVSVSTYLNESINSSKHAIQPKDSYIFSCYIVCNFI